jgi:hypothetical protein
MSSPFFHGIEHLTIDDEGYVSWRGKRVEHFEPDFAQTDAAKGKARILAARCKHLEAIGKDVNKFNLIFGLARSSEGACGRGEGEIGMTVTCLNCGEEWPRVLATSCDKDPRLCWQRPLRWWSG